MINIKSKIMYRFLDESRNVKDKADTLIGKILVKGTPTSSCWWSKMKGRADGFKNHFDALKHKQEAYLANKGIAPTNTGASAKTCPGIIEVLRHAYLVKCPTDVVITINKTGEYYFNIADSSILELVDHPVEQFYQSDNQLFKDKIAIKFDIKLRLKTQGFGYILTDPTYHGNSGCFVPIGMISAKYAGSQELNIITLIDLPRSSDTKTVTIKAGDVLAYLIPSKSCSLTFSKADFVNNSFLSSFNPKALLN